MIVDYSDLSTLATGKVTFVIGTFDILHVGHIHFLEEAKKAGNGNKLLVGIVPDKIVRERKGVGRPLNYAVERAELVNALSLVDYVFVAPELPIGEIATQVIQTVHPEFAVASREDWEHRTEDWNTEGTKLILIGKIPERSTTIIVQKIRE